MLQKNKFPRAAFPQYGEQKIGILLMNLGTPDAPTAQALRPYLGQFLHDWRVIEVSRWIWCLILHGIVLRTRPQKIAKDYAHIWLEEGSPLLVISKRQAQCLQKELQSKGIDVEVAVAMRYGNPSVEKALDELRAKNCQRILGLPLYPQYCCATTASSADAFFDELKKWRWMPEFRFITSYATDIGYIQSLANSVTEAWEQKGKHQKLIISFHGTPESFRDQGDPYYYECNATAQALASALELQQDEWIMTFQSQFGNDPWIKPSTSATLEKLATEGITSVDVICPGFSADCIETLEEIEGENREIFEEHGGQSFRYIPALNDRNDHIQALANLCANHLQGWTI